MRAILVLLVLAALVLAPTASAEFGRDDAFGYPIAVDGTSTFPGGVFPASMLPDGPVNQIGPFTLYPYYGVLTAEVQRLAADHPDLVHLTSIGQSTLGLEMWMLEIANFDDPDMIPLDEREVIWVDGGTHSNEYSGVWFTAHLASFLADGYGTNETATWIVENRHTWIMPMVNPDGSHAFGRLNAKGVNVNRNYPVDWGALAEDLVLNNPGPSPASEVETQANIAAFNMTRPDLYVSVHCCGNLWLYPYGVEGLDRLDQQAFSRICDEAFASVREDCGPIWSTIYPASGSSVDTVYEYTGAAAFGYEMSGRDALVVWGLPFTADAVENAEIESWQGILHGFLNVERYGAYPTLTAASVIDGKLTLRIRNDGYGNLTNATIRYTPFAPPTDALVADRGPVAKAFERTLLPGEEMEIALDGPIAAGAFHVTIDHVKRHMASPMGSRAFALDIREGAAGFEVLHEGEALAPLSTPGPEEGAPIPFLGPLAILALVGLLAHRRR